MKIEALGDSAYIARDLDIPAYHAARALESAGIPGLIEAVASYETLGLYVDPTVFEPSRLGDHLVAITSDGPGGASHTIPVCYDFGPDLEHCSRALGISAESLVALHASVPYRCFAVGFCPGFPYLGYLPAEISGLPRLPSPRTRVEPGSVGITGRQTGVYPLERPGGWPLIGKTPLTLVDENAGYFPIRAGDTIRFAPISPDEYRALLGERL